MVKRHHVEGYDNFFKLIDSPELKNKVIYVYYGGSKEGSSNQSWCDDCQRAWPYIEKEVNKLGDDCHFIYVEVGDRATWKDPKCPFRKNKRTNLLVIPTLVKWNSPQKLEGEKCENPELVRMLFADDDED